jgi:hypothetical protein
VTARTAPRAGWDGFSLWAGAGVLVSFSLAGAASIGPIVLPFAALAVVLLARRRGTEGTELLGLAAGFGLTLLGLAALNLDYTPCTGAGVTVAPGETSASCGGWNPLPFAIAGAVLLAGAVVAFARLRRAH